MIMSDTATETVRTETNKLSMKSQEALKEFMKASPVIETKTNTKVIPSGLTPEPRLPEKNVQPATKMPISKCLNCIIITVAIQMYVYCLFNDL